MAFRSVFNAILVVSILAMMGIPGVAAAQTQAPAACSINEGFDVAPPAGWTIINHSEPLGADTWIQGEVFRFPAHSGADTSYIRVDYDSTGDLGTISNWLITPQMSFSNGDVVQFYTRTADPQTPGQVFPDRLQVRLSAAGASTDVGITSLDTGAFSTLLLDINPTLTVDGYPFTWTLFSVTLSGLNGTVSGRLAFRYFVTDGGLSGNNSTYIGIDDVSVCGGGSLPTSFTYLPMVIR